MMIPSTEGMRNVYASVQALGIRSGPPGAIEYNHGKAKFDAWLAAIEREAAARALDRVGQDSRLTDAARDGMNQHGPFPWCAAEGVGEFLRARAAEIRKGDL